MFCSKCGKEIENGAAFCKFCGNSLNTATNSAPQYGAPQNGGYQNQPIVSGFALNLAPNVIDIIKKVLFGILGLLGILVLIGAIGNMATVGAIMNGDYMAAMSLQDFFYLARVPAIIAFIFSAILIAFTYLAKQNRLFPFIAGGAGVVLFVFNFVLYGGYMSLTFGTSYSAKPNIAGIIVPCVFLLLGALVMIGAAVLVILKKEYIVEDLINRFIK